MVGRWSIEQVEAIAPSAAAMSAARPLATTARWHGLGADERAVWGSFHGSGAEPYDTMVDHVTVGFSCTCPSRRTPCKHALALLLMWVDGHIVEGAAPSGVAAWLARRRPAAAGTASSGDASEAEPIGPTGDASEPEQRSDGGPPVDPERGRQDDPLPPGRPDHPDQHSGRDDRVARMYDGLNELDRWLVDRMRTGLADPSLARFETWDALASRLVDARAGSLANRIRRLAGVVGASPDWHERVLDEIGLLHLLSQAGRRLGALPDPLADRVATTIGWQVRQDDVLAGVPDTDDWIVAGRSDTREDRIEVRRFWLYGTTTNRWALALSFAAYRQSLDASLQVGTSIRADLHRYPGGALRSLIGDRFGEPTALARPPAASVLDACEAIGSMLAVEPWLDRVPAVVRAALTRAGGRWVLTDDTGTLPLRDASSVEEPVPGLDVLLAVSGGGPIDLTVEWTPTGVVPLAIHRPTGSIDIGPRAEPSFVGPSTVGARGQAPRGLTGRPAMTTPTDSTVGQHWEQLVTVALLGTDRRDPPDIGGPVGDLVADAVRASAAERMLAEVAAVAAIRRGGLLPLPPVPTLPPPRHDTRPVCRRAAADRWRHVVASWPVLEDEWMLTVIERGWRVDAEIVPAMLLRHRRDPRRWMRAVVASGPVAEWLIDQLPGLGVADRRTAGTNDPGGMGALEFLDTLPALPIPPDLSMLLVSSPADVATALRGGLTDGTLGSAHRVVLVNLLARVPPGGLPIIAAELAQVDQFAATYELAIALADLARTRTTMLSELELDRESHRPDGAVEGAGNDDPTIGRVAPE